MLDRLEAKSWIVFEVTVFSAGRRGRTRRVVRLTTENLTALRKSHGAMLTLWNGFERALDP
jgi:predicted ArsR family transcriptional regulator